MKINPINNNQTNFQAKVKIRYTKDGAVYPLSKSWEAHLKNLGKKIGTEKDTIRISLGKCNTNTESWSEMGHRCVANNKSRYIAVKSTINNKTKDKYIGYYTDDNNEHSMLSAMSISNYLVKLCNDVNS